MGLVVVDTLFKCHVNRVIEEAKLVEHIILSEHVGSPPRLRRVGNPKSFRRGQYKLCWNSRTVGIVWPWVWNLEMSCPCLQSEKQCQFYGAPEPEPQPEITKPLDCKFWKRTSPWRTIWIQTYEGKAGNIMFGICCFIGCSQRLQQLFSCYHSLPCYDHSTWFLSI